MQSVLGSLVLGFRPLWGRARTLCGIELRVQEATAGVAVDAPHLLRTLQELWEAHSPALLLAPQTAQLLTALLDHAPRGAPEIVVPAAWLGNGALAQSVQGAHRRGLPLVWRGDAGMPPPPALADCFASGLLTLSPQEAVRALQAGAGALPALAGQRVEGIASRALMERCLHQHGVRALLGWPQEDVLHGLRHQQPQPSHSVIHKLMKAIDAEQSLESFEDILGEDPLLAYRFLVSANSAALGLRTGIDSLRRGLVMLGYGSLLRWLSDQLPHASTEANLRPVREAMVLRAHLAERLIEAGVETALRREVYLCGLFAQLGELLHEPLGTVLRRIPLSERVYDAAVLHTGPYAPSLEMACALEGASAAAVCQLCEQHGMALEEVNRALLRVLSELHVAPAP